MRRNHKLLRYKAFRYRVYPTTEQVARIVAWESALRFLWNLANEQRRMAYERPKCWRGRLTAFDQINELKALRADLPWLADVPRDVCAQLLIELDKAWQRCFQQLARGPRWKHKGRDFLGLTAPHPKRWRLDGNTLRFPKLGNLFTVVHRPFEGKPKTCTLRREGDQWFASILCEIEALAPIERAVPIIAIDRGIANFGGTSDGELLFKPEYLKASLVRLAQAQRIVSRRKKGSKNREKAKLRVARLHRKVRRQREYYLHGLSALFAKSHGVVVLEKLNVAGMIRSRLARSIADAGWSRFGEMLRYKLAWSGGSLVEVPAAYSSQTCSACDHIDANSRRSQAVFCCTACGFRDHADLNAAKVLKSRANRSALLGEGTVPETARRTKKRLRVARRAPKSPALIGRG